MQILFFPLILSFQNILTLTAGQGKAKQCKVRKAVHQTKAWHISTTLPSGQTSGDVSTDVCVMLGCHLRFFVNIHVKRELIPLFLPCLVFIKDIS